MVSEEFASTVCLGSVCSKIGSGATPRGGSKVYLERGQCALIRSQNVHNEGFSLGGLVYIEPEHANQLNNVEVQSGDVLLNITGDSVARCCQVVDDVLPARVNQHVAIIRPNSSKLNPMYLRYYLVSPRMQAKMLSWARSGGTRNALTKEMIESFDVPAPNIKEQRAIAQILGSLEDKIESNQQENHTLEQMARAIFKSWFVDFDPVKAKAEGKKPVGMNAEAAKLFPDSFVDSELGSIPKGWEIEGLDEIASYLNGLALQKFPPDGNNDLRVIKIAQLRAGNTNGSALAGSDIGSEYVVNDGDIIFSWSGSLMINIWCGGKGALNQHLFKVTSAKFPKWFYYFWTLQHLPDFQHIAAGKATTMGHIQRRHLTAAKTIVPPESLLLSMCSIMSPFIDMIIRNGVQSRNLASIRDTLLPKLLSGKIRVKDAEKLVGKI